LYTTNPTHTGLRLNPDLFTKTLVTNCLQHGMTFIAITCNSGTSTSSKTQVFSLLRAPYQFQNCSALTRAICNQCISHSTIIHTIHAVSNNLFKQLSFPLPQKHIQTCATSLLPLSHHISHTATKANQYCSSNSAAGP